MTMKIAFQVLLLVAVALPVASQDSSNYSMRRVAVSAAAGTVGSPGFGTTIVIGHSSGATSFCNFGFNSGLGFWSVLGVLPIPNDLRADKSGNPVETELSWSGSTGQFEVYRSTSPVDLIDPVNLFAVTGDCTTVDPDPNSTVYYKVMSVPTP